MFVVYPKKDGKMRVRGQNHGTLASCWH